MSEASNEQPARPPPTGVPPAFVIAIATMLIVGIALSLFAAYAGTSPRHEFGDRDSWVFQFMFIGRGLLWSGSALATTSLAAVGFAELARRSGPSTEGHVLRAGMLAAIAMLVIILAGLYMNYWWTPHRELTDERQKSIESFWLWRQRLFFTAAMLASASVIVAGRRHTLVLALAVPLLVFTALQYPTRWIAELVRFEQPTDDGELWLQSGLEIWFRIGFCGSFMAVVTAVATKLPPAPTDMVRAGQGLERVGSGLVARVIVLLVTAFTLIMTVGAQSPSMARVAGVIFPTCLLVASLAIVTGMIQAGGLTASGAPRLRLYAGGALSITAMAIDALKALSLYMALRRGGDFGESFSERQITQTAAALPYLTPALGLAGLLCTLSAAARLRRMAPEARVDEAGINAAAASVIIFTASAVALLRWAQSGVRSPGMFVMVSLIVAVANIIAQLAVARVCHRVGAAMREQSGLPVAVAAFE
ncbi:MAG TPA: hypothetical protein VM261_13505 [Kofleriaceae bacterium]|nr:hypothetical protein [Kofleriaceae bacterium]